jgi:hypothetical protein
MVCATDRRQLDSTNDDVSVEIDSIQISCYDSHCARLPKKKKATYFPSRRITCNLTGTSYAGKTGFTSVGKGGLAASAFAAVGVSASSLAALLAALLRRGVVVDVFSCFVDAVETFDITEEDRPRLGVDLRELGMAGR